MSSEHSRGLRAIAGASLIAATLLASAAAAATSARPGDIGIDVVADDGRVFPRYPLARHGRAGTVRAYLEAEHGRNYAIRVRNRTGRRIGVVIAVDGRNIISGKKSHLGSSEPMYVLGPYAGGVYEGWRTSSREVHRFFFTDAQGSYAEAWGDRSAMGVIAVAAFREVPPPRPAEPQPYREGPRADGEKRSAAPAPGESADSAAAEPGTGFGERRYSHAVRVEFEPQPRPFARHFLKYEWRDTLIAKGIIPAPPRHNRFWPYRHGRADSEGFAPYPPR